MSDLDGYRDNAVLLASRIAEVPPQRMLFQRLHLGDAALRIMQGLDDPAATRLVLANLIAQCEIEAHAALDGLMRLDRLDVAEARELHLQARVCASIVGKINQFVRDGMAAGDQLNNHEDS